MPPKISIDALACASPASPSPAAPRARPRRHRPCSHGSPMNYPQSHPVDCPRRWADSHPWLPGTKPLASTCQHSTSLLAGTAEQVWGVSVSVVGCMDCAPLGRMQAGFVLCLCGGLHARRCLGARTQLRRWPNLTPRLPPDLPPPRLTTRLLPVPKLPA